MSFLERRTQGAKVSDSREDIRFHYSKGIRFFEVSLLGGNSPDHVDDLIGAAFEALQGDVTPGVGLEMYAQDLDARAWSDALAVKKYLNALLGRSFEVRAGNKKL